MTLADFQSTIAGGVEPAVAPLLLALWHDARGDWDRAHTIAQDIEDEHGSLVHAYLHRKEGDLANAGYWYRRARRPVATDSLQSEWTRIVTELLGAGL
jgi:hypothetical protein